MSEGWRCPGCGSCYAPSVSKCPECRGTIAFPLTPNEAPLIWPSGWGAPDHTCEPSDENATIPMCKHCGRMLGQTASISWPMGG